MNRRVIAVTILAALVAGAAFAQIEIPRSLFYIQSAAAYGTDQGYLDLPGVNPSYRAGANLALYHFEEGEMWDRLYQFQALGDGWYSIVPANGGCLQVEGGGTANGTNVTVGWNEHRDNQRFRLEHTGGDRFKIYTSTGQVLSTAGRSVTDGTNVHIWEDHDVPATGWYLIWRHSGRPFHIEAPVQPFGSVSNRATGAPVSGATITVVNTNDSRDQQYTVRSGSDGSFAFDAIPSIRLGYDVIVSAPGYGSVAISSHKSRSNGPHSVRLEPVQGYLQVDVGRFGTWLYEERELESSAAHERGTMRKYYAYRDGETESDDEFYFPFVHNRAPVVRELMASIGLDGSPAITDAEIYAELVKVWSFWEQHTRSVGLSNLAPADQAAIDDLYLPEPLPRWPSVDEYAEVFRDHGFIPTQNCSSNTMAFAALMSLTGIDRSKMAIEVMHPVSSTTGEHWSVIIRLKGAWYWIDPQLRGAPLNPLETFASIPTRTSGLAYDTPFRIITFPGSEALMVPLCGRVVESRQDTDPEPEPELPQMKYVGARFSGTEPFWSLSLDRRNRILFTPSIGEPQQEFTVTYAREFSSGRMMLRGQTGDEVGRILVIIEEKESTDDMSGRIYPYSIRLYLNGARYSGIGFQPER